VREFEVAPASSLPIGFERDNSRSGAADIGTSDRQSKSGIEQSRSSWPGNEAPCAGPAPESSGDLQFRAPVMHQFLRREYSHRTMIHTRREAARAR
jgi:hypothetical protein